MKKPPLVLVTWEDSVMVPKEHDIEEARDLEPVLLEDVGFLLTKDDDRVVIAATLVEELGDVRNISVIPRAMVRSIKRVASK